jgi:hypothetical protein
VNASPAIAELQDCRIGERKVRRGGLPAIFLSTLFLSTLFLSTLFLSTLFLSTLFLSAILQFCNPAISATVP